MATAVLKIGAPLGNVDRKSNQEFCNGLSANFPYKEQPQNQHIISESKPDKEDFERLLFERDEFWKQQLKSQISFVKDESAQLIGKLHIEVERLHNRNREVERQLAKKGSMANELLAARENLAREEKTCAYLRKELEFAAKRNSKVAQTLEKTIQIYKDQIGQKEQNIHDLTERIHDLTFKNAQLHAKMNRTPRESSFRRSANAHGPKQRSQSSGHDTFPPSVSNKVPTKSGR